MAKLRKAPKAPKKPKGNPTAQQAKAYEARVITYTKKCADIKKYNDGIRNSKTRVNVLYQKATQARASV